VPSDKLLDKFLDGEFDPEEYDKQMAAMFDDEYYEVGGWCLGGGGCLGGGDRLRPGWPGWLVSGPLAAL
jgi:hypothetical protein